MREQPHGGALRTGGTNAGGPGRPPSWIRQRLTGSYAERIETIERMADGTLDIPLRQRCEHCGKIPSKQPTEQELLKRAVPPADMRGAMEHMARYGFGPVKEVNLEEAQAFVETIYRVLEEKLPKTQFDEVDVAISRALKSREEASA